MIQVNGSTFRTLDDEFFVNGKKVLEAYANGTKVYPEKEQSKHPAGIKLISPPDKTVYRTAIVQTYPATVTLDHITLDPSFGIDTEINLSGIKVQLIDINGDVWTSDNYPDGIVPEEYVYVANENPVWAKYYSVVGGGSASAFGYGDPIMEVRESDGRYHRYTVAGVNDLSKGYGSLLFLREKDLDLLAPVSGTYRLEYNGDELGHAGLNWNYHGTLSVDGEGWMFTYWDSRLVIVSDGPIKLDCDFRYAVGSGEGTPVQIAGKTYYWVEWGNFGWRTWFKDFLANVPNFENVEASLSYANHYQNAVYDVIRGKYGNIKWDDVEFIRPGKLRIFASPPEHGNLLGITRDKDGRVLHDKDGRVLYNYIDIDIAIEMRGRRTSIRNWPTETHELV